MERFIKNHKQFLFVLLWLLWGFYLIYFYRQVFIHFDDFGYGALAYGWTGNPHGMKWTFQDLLDFLSWHYTCWGGRILFFAALCCILRAGEQVIQLVQPGIIFGITFIIYQLAKREGRDLTAAALSTLVFGMIGKSAVIDGVLWYTAAAVYVWPAFFLFLAVLLLDRMQKRGQYRWQSVAGLCLLLFVAGFSHEQTAVMTMVMMTVYLICLVAAGRTNLRQLVLPLASAAAGALTEILAPGNFARAGAASEFYSLSLFEKIQLNLPGILSWNFGKGNLPFVILMMAMMTVGALRLSDHTENRFRHVLPGTVFVAEAAVPASWFIHNVVLQFIINAIFLIVFLTVISVLTYKNNKVVFALFLGAVCSQGMMLLSPGLSPRVVLPFQLACLLVGAYIIHSPIGKVCPAASRYAFMAVALASVFTLGYITAGYARNAETNRYNRRKLRENAAMIRSGEAISDIVLHRLPDDRFTVCMPYFNLHPDLDGWVRLYYGIPQDVNILWE